MMSRRYSHNQWDWETKAELPANRSGQLRQLWRYCWGLIFVCAMAALSEWGPRILSHTPVNQAIHQHSSDEVLAAQHSLNH